MTPPASSKEQDPPQGPPTEPKQRTRPPKKAAEQGRVRIIGGRWRRRFLPIAKLPDLRPTPDRARETIFNWITPKLHGAHCLDLFAGSGVLALEALSRGAHKAVLVENHPQACQNLRKQLHLLDTAKQAKLWEEDVVTWLQHTTSVFDIVFLDPPYTSDLQEDCCALLLQKGILAKKAHLILESDAGAPAPTPKEQLQLQRQDCFGRSRIQLFTF